MTGQKKTLLYWTIQVLSWGAFTGALLLTILYFSPDQVPTKAILLQVVIGLSALLSSHAYRLLIKRCGWTSLPLRRLLPRILGGSLLAGFCTQVLVHLAMLTVLDWEAYRPIVWADFPIYMLNISAIMLVWSALYFAYHTMERARQAKLDAVRAEAALKEAELIALKAQINPHFLFNALNNIKALILEDAEKAREALTNLSELLRYSVQFSERERVSLQSELEVVQKYLRLEAIHYDRRLTYVLEIGDDTLDRLIPPMVIQLMVENAVKHGIARLERGGEIRIATRLRGDDLLIRVENTGALRPVGRSGIGLRNALDRIRLLFESEPDFQLTEAGGKVYATLTLPAVS